MEKKSLIGYLLKSDKVNKILITQEGFIKLSEFYIGITKKYLPDFDDVGYKRVRVTIKEIK